MALHEPRCHEYRTLLFALFAGVALALAITPVAASDIFSGRRVYQVHCTACHGINGAPMMAGVPDMTRAQNLLIPDRDLVTTLKRGKGVMPGYDRILSEKNILDVIAYVRSLQR